MGIIFFDFPNKEPVIKTYLGYGYWLITYDDGSKELFKKETEGILPLSKCEQFDQNGYPQWTWKRAKNEVRNLAKGTLLEDLNVIEEEDYDAYTDEQDEEDQCG